MKTTKFYSVLAIAGLSFAGYNTALAHQTNINLTPSFSSGTNYDSPTIAGGTLAYDPSGSLNNGYAALGTNANTIRPSNTLFTGTTITDPCSGAAGSHTACLSINDATRFGWYNGTQSNLGDTHSVAASPVTAIFYVSNPNGSVINLTETQWINTSSTNPTPVRTTGLNPAFSVYSGVMYNLSHDDGAADPLTPTASDNFGDVVTAVSKSDAAPNDPGIRSQYFDVVGNTIANPDWNKTFVQIQAEAGHQDAGYAATGENYNNAALAYLAANVPTETPAQWYAANYVAHNGYRDTLNFTQTGGLNNFGAPNKSYLGQFDAFGNFSLSDSTGAGLVSGLKYVASASDSPCSGPACTNTYANILGFSNVLTGGGHAGVSHTTAGTVANSNGSDSADETLTLFLPQGWYSVWFGGESAVCAAASSSCTGVNGGSGNGANTARLYSTLTYDVVSSNAVAAVPLPASVWLFASSLLGLGLFKRNKVIS